MLETMQTLYLILAAAACILAGYSLRGWLDHRAATYRQRLLDQIADDLAALEAFKPDNSSIQAEKIAAATDAAKLASLKARIAALP